MSVIRESSKAALSFFKFANRLAQQLCEPVLGQINPRDVRAEQARHFGHRHPAQGTNGGADQFFQFFGGG